jgi:hypothetical protein
MHTVFGGAMLEVVECVVGHEEVNGAVVIIPLQGNATILGRFPVNG